MGDYLARVFPFALDAGVLCLVYLELSVWCRDRGRSKSRYVMGAVAGTILLVVIYSMASPFALSEHPVAYFLVAVWLSVLPVVALHLGSNQLAAISAPFFRHVGLAAWSFAVAAAWPYLGLWSLCTFRLECT